MATLSTANSDLKYLITPSKNKIYVSVLIAAVLLGLGSGYIFAKQASVSNVPKDSANTSVSAKSAAADTQTFRDFAEGVIQNKPTGSAYDEGTHILVRDGAASVALTSSVVDLSQYVGKKVKVYGETQKALKEGWLMDVGRVDIE